MEKLDEENCGPNGTKPLSFFRTNIKVIKSVYLDVEEREAIREELKNHFDTLLYHPVGNNLYCCFIKWRAVISKCRFTFLIRIVKDAYELRLRNNFDLHCMDDWKQKDDEPVRGYNRRYRQRLIELYPDFMNKLYRMTNNRSDEANFLRTEIVGNYIASLKNELVDIMPIFKRNEKSLEIVMETAEYYEKEWAERKKRR
uniref:Uncharacterized protein n=1 Tax=Strongyloides papillosus TaxID=174720 RepID=A0A0N5BAZ8_STREA